MFFYFLEFTLVCMINLDDYNKISHLLFSYSHIQPIILHYSKKKNPSLKQNFIIKFINGLR